MWCYASVVLGMACVRLPLSVRSWIQSKMAEGTELIFAVGASFNLSCPMLEENLGPSKTRVLLLFGTLSQILDLENFSMSCWSSQCVVDLVRRWWTLGVVKLETIFNQTTLTKLATFDLWPKPWSVYHAGHSRVYGTRQHFAWVHLQQPIIVLWTMQRACW